MLVETSKANRLWGSHHRKLEKVHDGTWRNRWTQRARVQQAYYNAHPERFRRPPSTPAPAGIVGINLPAERRKDAERLQTG